MTAATLSARNDGRVPCPQAGCGYSAEPRSSIAGHVAMAHPEVPMDAVAPRRKVAASEIVNSARLPGVSLALELAVAAGDAEEDDPSLTTPAVSPAAGVALLEIPLDLVDVGSNVRVTLEAIDELAASIAEHGVLQPVKASRTADGRYRLLWGQRRVLAARLAGLATVPAIVSDDVAAGERPIEQLVENLHRADLNPIDRATAMRAVVDGGISQADLARKLGVAPSTVSNALRLMESEPEVQELLRSGAISEAHVKAIVGLSAADQVEQANRGAAGSSAHELEGNAKYIRSRNEAAKKLVRENASAIKRAIAALTEAGVPAGAPVITSLPYNLDRDGIRAAIAEAGWPSSDGWGTDAHEGCDAFAWRLNIADGKGSTVERRCSSSDHWNARQAAKDTHRKEREAVTAAEEHELADAVTAALHAAIPSTLARLILRQMEDYSGKTWTEYEKLSDHDVEQLIASRVARSYGSKPIPHAKVVAALPAEAEA